MNLQPKGWLWKRVTQHCTDFSFPSYNPQWSQEEIKDHNQHNFPKLFFLNSLCFSEILERSRLDLFFFKFLYNTSMDLRKILDKTLNKKKTKTKQNLKELFFSYFITVSHPQNFLVITRLLGFPSSPQNEQSPTRSLRSTPGAQFPFPAPARPAGYGISVYSAALSRKKHELSSKNRSIKLFIKKKAAPLTLKNLLLLPNLCFS